MQQNADNAAFESHINAVQRLADSRRINPTLCDTVAGAFSRCSVGVTEAAVENHATRLREAAIT
jgi:hypothetical protein